MIETHQAIENIDSICSVDGLDGVFIGSGDLKLSIKAKSQNTDTSALFNQAVDTVLRVCNQKNIVAGVWCASVEDAKIMVNKGFKFIALKSDSMLLNEYAKKQSQAIKKISKN